MSSDMIPLISKALGETVYMVTISMIIATIIGIPLGVLLHTTSKNQILAFIFKIIQFVGENVSKHFPISGIYLL